jgi:hypothetical protein
VEYPKHGGGILVGIPSSRDVTIEWAMSMAAQSYPIGMPYCLYPLVGYETGEARNEIVKKALEMKTKYVWFVDDDTAAPVFAVRRLMYELEQQGPPLGKAMVCAGIYFTKEDPPCPVVFKDKSSGPWWQWKVNDVFECSGIGTGCMMVRTDLFEELPEPWFKTIDKMPTSSTVFKEQQTDDLYFCDSVIDKGYTILAHGGVLPLHWASDQHGKRFYGLPVNSYPAKGLDLEVLGNSVGNVIRSERPPST